VGATPIADGDRRKAEGEWVVALVRDLQLTPGVRYRELALRLRAAITSGELPVGARLPAQRDLARALSVGRTTVVAAYNILRAESLVAMTQGAGTTVTGRPQGLGFRSSPNWIGDCADSRRSWPD
jgi:DNA-binding FadR family transcriptional regulator